jgi:transcription antitermination factor NusG
MTLTWYCARTAPRREEQARKGLAELGLTAYLPLEMVTVIRRGSRLTLERPLFSRLLFVGVRPGSSPWRAIAETDGVERLLSAERHGAPSVVPWRAIAIVQTAEEEMREDYERRIAKRRRARRGPPDELIDALKKAQPDERAEVVLGFIQDVSKGRQAPVTMKLADLARVA